MIDPTLLEQLKNSSMFPVGGQKSFMDTLLDIFKQDKTPVKTKTTKLPLVDSLPKTFADTLVVLMGNPKGGVGNKIEGGHFGEYIPSEDKINVNSFSPKDNPRLEKQSWNNPDWEFDESIPPSWYTLAHEFGHRGFEKKRKELNGVIDSVVKLYGKDPRFLGNSDPSEAFAQAFAEAQNVLRATGTMRAPIAKNQVSKFYRQESGTQIGSDKVVEWLLKQPLYSKHPLNKK